MDVNGTRFHLVLGRDDWGRWSDDRGRELDRVWAAAHARRKPAVAWDDERCELTLQPGVFEFPTPARDRPPRLADRRGAASDRFGNWYWIAPGANALLVYSAGSDTTTQLWSPADEAAPAHSRRFGEFGDVDQPPPPSRELSGLAVTDDHYLVVGARDPGGLLVFDLQSGGPPTSILWPESVPLRPSDLAARPGGGVVILDADNLRAWELDRRLRVVPALPPAGAPASLATFQPAGGGATRIASAVGGAAVTEDDATTLSGDPISIEAGADRAILVLDRRASARSSAVRLYRNGHALGAAAATAEPAAPLRLHVHAHDMALVRRTDPRDASVIGTLFVADDTGNQAYEFTARIESDRLRLKLEHRYYPMRLFGGKGIVAAGAEAYYDFGDGWIPLVCQPRSQYVPEARILSEVFDGDVPGCVWHRLLVDAIVPPGTSVAVASRAADERDELELAQWRPEPDPRPRPRGVEVPFYESQGPYETHELLFQRAHGRYLQLRLDLVGDGRSSPRLRAVRAHFPRFSYLERYLPAVYREDSESASFLDRYLANVEGMYTAIEEQIAEAQVLLDPRTAPSEALAWLAGWFDVSLDPMWGDAKRRLLIRNAMRFFQLRGTMRGVEAALRLAFERDVSEEVFDAPERPGFGTPRLVESFRTRKTPGVVFGDPTDLGGPRIVARTERWTPTQGRELLNARWRDYLERAGLPRGTAEFPVEDPGDETSAAWRRFAAEAIGFVPESPAGADAAWRAYLEHRYANTGERARAYGETGAGGGGQPNALPADGAALLDWFQFQSVVLPMRRRAHRFTVLLPANLEVWNAHHELLTHDELRELTARIVDLQKPAHTRFAVKFFWAAFRIGEARLGDDTVIESGSRVPELVRPSVLGREHLGETYLGGFPARDELRRPPPTEPNRQETP